VSNEAWGEPPQDSSTFASVSVDPRGIHRFWVDNYVKRFIPQGGSKVKWIQGSAGSGKSHALLQLAQNARADGMLVVEMDAHKVWLRGIHEFVRAVLQGLPYQEILERLGEHVIENMGYQPDDIPAGTFFSRWLVESHGRLPARAHSDIHEAVDRMIGPLDMDLNLKIALGFGVDRVLGALEGDSADLDGWFRGDKVTRGRLASLGLSTPLSKLNARAVLQGWGVAALKAGFPGLLITVDGFEQVIAPKADDAPYYTRLRREETYEMVRQFIDDGDSLAGVWMVFSATKELFDDDRRGFKSYPALAARVHNDVRTRQFNRFQDLLDWDRLWDDAALLEELVSRWAEVRNLPPVSPAAPAGMVSPVRRSVLALRGVGAL
jgi:hypothetical protein